MKAKKMSSPRKRKSAARQSAARRKTIRKVAAAPRTIPSRVRATRKRTVAKRPLARKKAVTRRRRLPIPPILFEGDRPSPPPLSGPGEKFVLGDHPAAKPGEAAELPEAYGTGRLFVTSRDPHWLYAHWDLTREQQRRCNAQSAHGHLVLRTFIGAVTAKPASEIHVHPESRHWFAHVERAATEYVAELGYYGREHRWTRVAMSASAVMPPDTVSTDTGVTFATILMDTPFGDLLAEVNREVGENIPLARAWEQIRQHRQSEAPSTVAGEFHSWTPERERALAEVIRADTSPCAWMDSLAIAGLLHGWEQPEEQVSSLGAVEFGLAAWPAGVEEAISSPAGVEEAISSPAGGFSPGAKGFWFNVNAELVVYGATERDATVAFGGRKIALRPDGSFSYRFALPDGQYTLSVVAVSADDTDGRAVELTFARSTEFVGDVGTHPQEPGLLPPAAENVC